jgi:hypothetical protein
MFGIDDGRERLEEVNLDPCPGPAVFDKGYPLFHLGVSGPIIFNLLSDVLDASKPINMGNPHQW